MYIVVRSSLIIANIAHCASVMSAPSSSSIDSNVRLLVSGARADEVGDGIDIIGATLGLVDDEEEEGDEKDEEREENENAE